MNNNQTGFKQIIVISRADFAHLAAGRWFRDPVHQARSTEVLKGRGFLCFCNGVQEVMSFIYKLILQLQALSKQDLKSMRH